MGDYFGSDGDETLVSRKQFIVEPENGFPEIIFSSGEIRRYYFEQLSRGKKPYLNSDKLEKDKIQLNSILEVELFLF